MSAWMNRPTVATALRWLAALACAGLLAGTAAAQSLHERLAVLEQQGRAQPEDAARRAAALLGSLAPDSPHRVAALTLQGSAFATMHDLEGVERAATELEALAPRFGAPLAQAAAGFVRAQLLRHTGPLGRADRLMTEAQALLPQEAGVDMRIRFLQLHGGIKDACGRFDEAVRLYQRALALADPVGPVWLRSELRSSLAYTLLRVGQVDRARVLNREAVALAEQVRDHVAWSAAMTIEAILAGETNDDAGELRALLGAAEHARRAGSRRDEVLALANMADYYLRRGEWETADARAQEALVLARALKNASAEALALINSGLAQIGLQHKDEGLALVRAGLAIEERTGSIADMANTWQELGHYLERAGHLKDAFAAYRQHRQLADEVFNRDQQTAVLEMQESFDSERRGREIELLHRENRLKQEQLRHRELQHRGWAAGAAVGVLLLLLLVLLHRRLRESNAALATRNERLLEQSERDPLTEVANRRHFQAAMRAPAAEGALEGSVFLIDVDHFKRINDNHGHAAGDAVLVETARRLRAMLRDEDLVVRWGGEEFLVVVRSLAPEQVETMAARLLGAIGGEPVAAPERARIAVTVSIGFASFPLEPHRLVLPWERALELVDAAMYLAKAHGRNRAYGVRRIEAADGPEFERVTRELELAWREGRVDLTLLAGPHAGEPAP